MSEAHRSNDVLIHRIHFEELGSTQRLAIEELTNLTDKAKENSLVCISTDRQVSGVGKMGKIWTSPEGNLSSTFILNLTNPDFNNTEIVQRATLGVTLALESHNIFPSIKWINDLILNKQKCGGILCNRIMENGSEYLLVGIGINILAAPDTPGTTSILEATGINIDKDKLIQSIANALSEALRLGSNEVIRQYDAKLAFKGDIVQVECKENFVVGKLIGVDEQGLAILGGDGTILRFMDCKLMLT